MALALAGCGLTEAEREQATGDAAPAVVGASEAPPPPPPPVTGVPAGPLSAPLPSPSPAVPKDAPGDTGAPTDLLPGDAEPAAAPARSGARPSFDCARASAPAELAICDSAELSRLDRRLATNYAAALAAADGRERDRLVSDQRAFLRARDACDVDSCIEEAYRRQLRAVDRVADSAAADGSCEAEIGTARAGRLVRQCIEVSPATRPPCNARNACGMIRDEIARGCDMLDPGDRPGFCDR